MKRDQAIYWAAEAARARCRVRERRCCPSESAWLGERAIFWAKEGSSASYPRPLIIRASETRSQIVAATLDLVDNHVFPEVDLVDRDNSLAILHDSDSGHV